LVLGTQEFSVRATSINAAMGQLLNLATAEAKRQGRTLPLTVTISDAIQTKLLVLPSGSVIEDRPSGDSMTTRAATSLRAGVGSRSRILVGVLALAVLVGAALVLDSVDDRGIDPKVSAAADSPTQIARSTAKPDSGASSSSTDPEVGTTQEAGKPADLLHVHAAAKRPGTVTVKLKPTGQRLRVNVRLSRVGQGGGPVATRRLTLSGSKSNPPTKIRFAGLGAGRYAWQVSLPGTKKEYLIGQLRVSGSPRTETTKDPLPVPTNPMPNPLTPTTTPPAAPVESKPPGKQPDNKPKGPVDPDDKPPGPIGGGAP